MKISVIMPVHLGDRKHAAKDRQRKFIRAVNSFLRQEADCELVIVSDGDKQACQIVMDEFADEMDCGLINLTYMQKQPDFSGNLRNKGIEEARGEWICYLDADDVFGPEHLTVLAAQMDGCDWIFFNDLIWDKTEFVERTCMIEPYKCGTSNIAHKRLMQARWKAKNEYGKDDWYFINQLRRESKNWSKVDTPEYCVCHIPRRYDI